MDEISNEKLECIRVDAFINTACPRIEDLGKPFINADDVEEFLNW
jgi:diphthamide synthase subunit DPH2